jgi:hypothetical protein
VAEAVIGDVLLLLPHKMIITEALVEDGNKRHLHHLTVITHRHPLLHHRKPAAFVVVEVVPEVGVLMEVVAGLLVGAAAVEEDGVHGMPGVVVVEEEEITTIAIGNVPAMEEILGGVDKETSDSSNILRKKSSFSLRIVFAYNFRNLWMLRTSVVD